MIMLASLTSFLHLATSSFSPQQSMLLTSTRLGQWATRREAVVRESSLLGEENTSSWQRWPGQCTCEYSTSALVRVPDPLPHRRWLPVYICCCLETKLKYVPVPATRSLSSNDTGGLERWIWRRWVDRRSRRELMLGGNSPVTWTWKRQIRDHASKQFSDSHWLELELCILQQKYCRICRPSPQAALSVRNESLSRFYWRREKAQVQGKSTGQVRRRWGWDKLGALQQSLLK